MGDDWQKAHCDRALALFEEHRTVVRASLYKFVRNVADVDELTNEVFLRLLSTQLDEMKSPRAFLITIARNIAFDFMRHRSIVPIEYVDNFENLEIADSAPDPSDLVSLDEELRIILRAVNELSPKCRQVFTLRKIYGLSQKEIAHVLHISENTVEQHLMRGIRMIAVALEYSTSGAESSASRMLKAMRTDRERDETNLVDFPVPPVSRKR